MAAVQGHCRVATTFSASGGLDEGAFRQFLQRFVDAGIGVYLGSAGSGEGNALTVDELRRIYEIGVDVCRGKIPVNGNPPEAQTVGATRDHTLLAVKAGVEIVNIYGPTGWHSFRPTEAEFIGFFDDLLPDIRHPVALAPNPTMGYTPRPEWIAAITRNHHQVVAINLVGLNDDYLLDLQRMIDRPLDYNVPLTGSLNTLAMGAAGVIGGDFNLLPGTLRRYLDLYEAGDFAELSAVYADLKRFITYVSRWNSSNPRWIKMALKVLKLPGGDGGLRPPYRMPPPEELEIFAQGLLRLRIPELDAMARDAGLSVPV
jgi:4-hydroxy-tetrahydrodipicolinate synthase